MVNIDMTEAEAQSILAHLPVSHPMAARIRAELADPEVQKASLSGNGYGFKTLEEVQAERFEAGPQGVAHYEDREDVVYIPLLNTASIPTVDRED
jgi:hypothetical protein